MRTLSKKCQYALRALYHLAGAYQQGPVPISRIAVRDRIPRKFLEAILVEMRNQGLVESRQGKNGGYSLSLAPDEITLGSVIRGIDGPLAPLPCASETAFRRCAECVDVTSCETRLVMRDVRNAIAAILDQTTLEQACRRAEDARVRDEVSYDI